LERSTSTFFEPGDELVWFDEGEVNTMGAHTYINGRRNYFIHQADGLGSDQLFTVKRYDEETSTVTIIGRDLPDWETAKAVAQADFDISGEPYSSRSATMPPISCIWPLARPSVR